MMFVDGGGASFVAVIVEAGGIEPPSETAFTTGDTSVPNLFRLLGGAGATVRVDPARSPSTIRLYVAGDVVCSSLVSTAPSSRASESAYAAISTGRLYAWRSARGRNSRTFESFAVANLRC